MPVAARKLLLLDDFFSKTETYWRKMCSSQLFPKQHVRIHKVEGGAGVLVQGCLRASFDLVVVNTLIDPRSLLCIKDLSRHFREV